MVMSSTMATKHFLTFSPKHEYAPYVEPSTTANVTIHEWQPKNREAEINCLAKNIYFEGRGESLRGKIAIGLVTLNRVKHNLYPNTICKVVWEKGRNRSGRLVAQFSWTLDGNSNRPIIAQKWKDIILIARAMTADNSLSTIKDFTNGATHYHANYINPNWHNLSRLVNIDTHIFYKDRRLHKKDVVLYL